MQRRTALKLLAGAVPALGMAQTKTGEFNSSWESLKRFTVPEWYRDAKLGFWAHWGPQCVPQTGDWYARNMYIEDSPQYKYHLEHYGHPSKFGYKDIVPLWKAEKFDPEHLVALYKKAGAKYFVSMGVHHDNFDIWNSKHHKWNAANMGPKKDIVGLWAKAARKAGLRFGVTEHLERSWSWFNVNKGPDKKGPLAGVPYDGSDSKYQDFYFPPHEDNSRSYPLDPPDAWKQTWLKRITDLVDSYQPDLLYTDGGIPFGEVGRQLVAHYYNQGLKWHRGKQEVLYTIKNVPDGHHGDYQDGCALLDLERGVVQATRPDAWQTDTCIGDWYYKAGMTYKTPLVVVHLLVDIVAKNGNLLLNIPLRPDGTMDSQEQGVLDEFTQWMAINAEGIHGTRPYKVLGEGPTQATGGMFGERDFKGFTADDIRFTTKGGTLYAFVMGWKPGEVTIQNAPANVRRVEMLGVKQPLQFTREGGGLKVKMPGQKPCNFAVTLKIV